MNLLEFKDVKKSFAKKEVLKGISFSVKKGEIFGLIGLSGGGKTTLFNILTGLVTKDSGDIFFENEKIEKNLEKFRKGWGFATQSNMIFEELSTKENSEYFGSLYGLSKKDVIKRFNSLIELFKLQSFEDTLVRNLSGGMKKRSNLLISLIHSPTLLILDEPTVGLDPVLRASLWKYIKEINKAGTTILVSSHLIDEIEENCDNVAIIKKGKIFSSAKPKEYLEKYKYKTLQQIFEVIMQNENI